MMWKFSEKNVHNMHNPPDRSQVLKYTAAYYYWGYLIHKSQALYSFLKILQM